MTDDPYRPPAASAAPAPPLLSTGLLVGVAVSYGGCGSLLSLPMAVLQEASSLCSGAPATALSLEQAWALAALASVGVPVALYRRFGTRALPHAGWRALLGAVSVFIAVLVTFIAWAVFDGSLAAGPLRSLAEAVSTGTVMGGLLTPVGVVLGWLVVPVRRAPHPEEGAGTTRVP